MGRLIHNAADLLPGHLTLSSVLASWQHFCSWATSPPHAYMQPKLQRVFDCALWAGQQKVCGRHCGGITSFWLECNDPDVVTHFAFDRTHVSPADRLMTL